MNNNEIAEKCLKAFDIDLSKNPLDSHVHVSEISDEVNALWDRAQKRINFDRDKNRVHIKFTTHDDTLELIKKVLEAKLNIAFNGSPDEYDEILKGLGCKLEKPENFPWLDFIKDEIRV